MRTLAETLVAVADVDGWMTDAQAASLHRAASATHGGQRIVEIGSFRGRSAIVLASAAPDGVEIVAIDPHAGNDRGPQEISGFAAEAATDHEIFLANLDRAGVRDRVRHVRAFSHDALALVDGPVDVLYIDGAHRYGPALADIREWGRRVSDGGTLLIHDAFSALGVTAAIGRELVLGRRWRYLGRAGSLVEYRADLTGSRSARVSNAARQVAQLPWFLRNLLIKVAIVVRIAPLVQRVTGRTLVWPY